MFRVLLDRVSERRALRRVRPDHLFHGLAGLVLLPLRQNHGVSLLQTVLVRFGRKLGPAIEGGPVYIVQRRSDFVALESACLLDSVLEDEAGGIATRRLVAGFGV